MRRLETNIDELEAQSSLIRAKLDQVRQRLETLKQRLVAPATRHDPLLMRAIFKDITDLESDQAKVGPHIENFGANVAELGKASLRGADRLLGRIEAWTPIALREELLGDVREDMEHRREQGWTEKKLRRLIWWQFSYAIVGWLWSRMERVLELIPRSGK